VATDPASSSHVARRPGPAAHRAAAQVFVEDLEALELADDDVHHLTRVLRLRAGEPVIAADGRGGWRPTAFSAEGTVLEATGSVVTETRPSPPVVVGFVPVKGERPEWVVQKLTEVGVDRIVVLRSVRSVVRWQGERAALALDRLRRVAHDAAAQSRRAFIPEVEGIFDPDGLAAVVAPMALALAEPGAPPPTRATTAVAVGPEGGWDPEELAAVPGHVGLGPGILRAETAAMGAGILLCAFRDGVAGPPGGGSG
jgi:16S rRNA (uracil1498-N3)-methyltransferase